MLYWYSSHLGGIYSSTRKLSYDDLYCEQCGDCDEYLGRFETEEEAYEEYRRYMGFDEEDDMYDALADDSYLDKEVDDEEEQ